MHICAYINKKEVGREEMAEHGEEEGGARKAQGPCKLRVPHPGLPGTPRPQSVSVASLIELASGVHAPANTVTRHKELKGMWVRH